MTVHAFPDRLRSRPERLFRPIRGRQAASRRRLARAIAVGAHAVFAGQLVGTILPAFDALPLTSRYAHLVSVAAVGMGLLLLVIPGAIRGGGPRASSRIRDRAFAGGLAALLVGLGIDLYVVVAAISGAPGLAALAAAAAVVLVGSLTVSVGQRARAVRA